MFATLAAHMHKKECQGTRKVYGAKLSATYGAWQTKSRIKNKTIFFPNLIG